jgi:hypothetical protein
MLAIKGVGEEFGEGLRSLEGGDSREGFGGRGGVRSGGALQSSDETLVSPGGELCHDSFAQHTSEMKIIREIEETW